MPGVNPVIGLALLLSSVFLSIWNLFDAHHCARKQNSSSFEKLRKSSKDPWLAVFLSRIIPGIGHFYIDRNTEGMVFIILAVILSPLSILIQCFAAINSYYLSNQLRDKTIQNKQKKGNLVVLSIIVPTIIAFFTTVSWRVFVIEARYIPSGSMLPTLEIHDRVIVNKASYILTKPNRGDIIVFQPTPQLRQLNFNDVFIKRLIGLPGETVEVKGGRVYINNKPLGENYIAEPPDYQYGPVVVPDNNYLVLGDNRNNSYDSHYWGFVAKENIVGQVSKIFWPPNRWGEFKPPKFDK